MHLRMKLLLGFLTLSGMLVVAGIWSIYALSSLGESVQKLLDDNYRSITAAEEMVEALERQDSGVLLLLLGRSAEGREIIDEARLSFEEAFSAAGRNITIDGERAVLDRIRENYGSYEEVWRRPIVDTEREGNISWYFELVHQRFLAVKSSVNDLKRLNERSLYGTASELKGRAERAVVPGTVATIAALVFSVLFSYLVNRFMVGPISRITGAANAFVRHGTPFRVQVDTSDEIGELAEAVGRVCVQDPGGRR